MATTKLAALTEAEMAHREAVIAEVVHSTELEAGQMSTAWHTDAQEFVHGAIDADELVRRTRARYGLA